MFHRTLLLSFTLAAVFVFHGWSDRFSFSFLMAEDLKSRPAVEFIVGGYLLSEGGEWKAAESPCLLYTSPSPRD